MTLLQAIDAADLDINKIIKIEGLSRYQDFVLDSERVGAFISAQKDEEIGWHSAIKQKSKKILHGHRNKKRFSKSETQLTFYKSQDRQVDKSKAFSPRKCLDVNDITKVAVQTSSLWIYVPRMFDAIFGRNLFVKVEHNDSFVIGAMIFLMHKLNIISSINVFDR